MNTLLHVFEGYAGLYQASRDPEVEKALRRILDIYEHKIYSPELHRQLVFFDQHYNSIIDLYSYGHDRVRAGLRERIQQERRCKIP